MPPSSRISVLPVLRLILPSHRGVPVVLDGIIRPTWQQLRYPRPLVTQHLMGLIYDFVFVFRPGTFFYFGVQVVVPPLSALLPDPPLQVAGYQGPFLGAVLVDEFDNLLVLLKCGS